jgi:hypothetical protein
MPSAQAAGGYLNNDGLGTLAWATAGDLAGPASAVMHAVPRFSASSGKAVATSAVSIGDSGEIASDAPVCHH